MDRPIDPAPSRRRRTGLAVGAVAILLTLVAGAWPTAARWLGSERSVDRSRVRTARVDRGDIERDVAVQGRVVATHAPMTFSPSRGTVRLEVAPGDVVEQGALLARVGSPDLESRLQQERATLTSLELDLERAGLQARREELAGAQRVDLLEVELEAARRALDRARRSSQLGILNLSDHELAEDAVAKAELTLAHARDDAALERDAQAFERRGREIARDRQRLAVEDLERQVSALAIRSPVAGQVSRVDVADRDAVVDSQPLVSVVDLSSLEVEIEVPEAYADELGPEVTARIGIGGEHHVGELASIAPEVQGSRVQARLRFAGPPPPGLIQNQRVSVRLLLETRRDVLKVARGPFLESGGGRQAYVVDGDLAVRRPVRIGASSVREVEVLEGLELGDEIVVSDTGRFASADRVYLRR